QVGDVLDLPMNEAELLLAEGWAQPVSKVEATEFRGCSAAFVRAEAADMQRSVDRVRRVEHQIDRQHFEPNMYRRIEDRCATNSTMPVRGSFGRPGGLPNPLPRQQCDCTQANQQRAKPNGARACERRDRAKGNRDLKQCHGVRKSVMPYEQAIGFC